MSIKITPAHADDEEVRKLFFHKPYPVEPFERLPYPEARLFYRRPLGSAPRLLGVAHCSAKGWRFASAVNGRLSSRGHSGTMEGCIPPWVGYPDLCESREV